MNDYNTTLEDAAQVCARLKSGVLWSVLEAAGLCLSVSCARLYSQIVNTKIFYVIVNYNFRLMQGGEIESVIILNYNKKEK